uniref:Uncharacterized protein n=2 Tax=Gossypium raimondii TaxID=29730 RepID=A0A0D2QSM6_GOSRA|nr:hypothetical protein B456_004G256200 [Gossypium raimondii]KJB22680.1 hypothetical protein B456_004G256200 [Gossypium raimondii]
MKQVMQLPETYLWSLEWIKVHADEGGVTQTKGGIYWVILLAGYLGSSFWGMALILASTNLLTAILAAGCFLLALVVVLFYDELISQGVNSSDAEKFAEICPCPCNGVGWGFIWGMISFIFLGASVYLGLLILA